MTSPQTIRAQEWHIDYPVSNPGGYICQSTQIPMICHAWANLVSYIYYLIWSLRLIDSFNFDPRLFFSSCGMAGLNWSLESAVLWGRVTTVVLYVVSLRTSDDAFLSLEPSLSIVLITSWPEEILLVQSYSSSNVSYGVRHWKGGSMIGKRTQGNMVFEV